MRIVLKLLLALVVIVIAGLVALPFVVDPNDYKDEISSQVEKATGRTLTLQGDIGLSVFPWIALELGPLSLSNAPGFKADAFAQVEAAEIRIKLMPLLKKQLEMDTIVLDGLVLNLETDKDGKTNWEDLGGRKAEKPDEATPQRDRPVAEEPAAPALAAISIAGVRLSDANILWSNAATGESYQLRNLNLNTDPLEPGKPTALDMNFDLISAKPEARAHVTLASKVMVDMENQRYALSGLKFTTLAEGKVLPVEQLDLALSGDIDADMVSQLITVSGLRLTAKADQGKQAAAGEAAPFDQADVTLSADVSADLGSQHVTVSGLDIAAKASKDKQKLDATITGKLSSNLASQQTAIDELALIARIDDPALPGGRVDMTLNTNVLADLQQQTLSLSALVLKLRDLVLEADIQATGITGDNPGFSGTIDLKPFNLRKLAGDLKVELPEMADASTLQQLALRAELEGSTNRINAKTLHLVLDQSQIDGQFAVNNFDNPAFAFKLKLDEIDADRYLPPVREGESQPAATPATAAAGGSGALPLDTLRQINAKGSIDIGKLKITGLRSENIHVTIDAGNGLVKLTPMRAELYQGRYTGNVSLDAREDTLKIAVDEKLEGVQAGPLLKDMTGDDKFTGSASLNAKLAGHGATIDQIKQSLDGNGAFSFSDGAVKGVNIAESIRKASAALKGQSVPESDAPVQTDFSSLTGSFTVNRGVIDNQDLAVMSPLLRINGAGQASLPTEAIDYGLRVAIVGTLAGQGGKELEELKGLTIPVRITGTFSEPKPAVDLASLVQERAKEEIKSRAEEKIKEKLGDDIGGLLGGALGGSTATEQAPADDETTDSAPAPTEQPAEEAPKAPEKQLEDAVKDKLRSFF